MKLICATKVAPPRVQADKLSGYENIYKIKVAKGL
jgi:hypothetical protein